MQSVCKKNTELFTCFNICRFTFVYTPSACSLHICEHVTSEREDVNRALSADCFIHQRGGSGMTSDDVIAHMLP